MAHPEQAAFIDSVVEQYPDFFSKSRVLEVGSLNINGTVRDAFNDCDYLGIDVAPGRGVDLVCEGQNYGCSPNLFDTVISCECFEHNPFWVETFRNMHRVCRPGGLIIVTCATTGRAEHGTSRAEPASSPLTVRKGWTYYRNLTKADFVHEFELDSLFASFEFSSNLECHDLYFVGVCK
jgi:SAM-dependent methyltransferase